jgi:NAD(P)-dependent dehydrogenase (short-subunit alcohol dehydrogenase family)
MSRLSSDAAFVTSAGGGIGRAIAERRAAEGARVAPVGQRSLVGCYLDATLDLDAQEDRNDG